MQCTPHEIEQKRLLAQQRLLQKKTSPYFTSTTRKPDNNIHSPIKNVDSKFTLSPLKNHVLKSPSNSIAHTNKFTPYGKPKTVVQFYGSKTVIIGTCALISDTRFVVQLNNYSQPAVEVFKTVPSKSYDPKTRLWDFHINDYPILQQKMSYLQPDVILNKFPPFVLDSLKINKPSLNFDLSQIDEELFNILMPHQIEGVCFGIDKNGRCLIADEMGLGKTFQALAIANYYIKDWPLLIVTTSSMKNEWEETIHKFLPSISVMHTQYMTSGKDYIGDSKILIVSYELMSRYVEKLLERNFKGLIMDESHILKNFKTKCTKAATQLAKNAKRIILLSGTPALSRPNELYTQLSLLDDKFFGNFFEFSKRYCDGKSSSFGWDSSGKSNLQELEVILAKKFMIRRTKEDILKNLPNKQQEVINLDVNLAQFTEEDRECLNALALKYNRQKKGTDKHSALLTFFGETSKIKIPSVCSFILQTLETEKKFIVFAHHKKMLDAIEQVLRKKKKKFIRIDGKTTGDQRKYFVDKFQLNDEYVCALLSITAANAGITLTAAKLVIFAELHWNPSILNQAESRAHRIGQDEVVIIKYLLASGTADDSIWTMLQDKQKILMEAGLNKDSFKNLQITNQDLNNKEPIADCLKIPKITSYFSPFVKKSTGTSSKEESTSNFELDVDFEKFLDGNINNEACISNKENLNIGKASISDKSATCELFNDDFEEILENHDVIDNIGVRKNNLNSSQTVRDNSVEMELLDDGFDDLLSNVELNI